eukprot:TRINITY_DN8016_c0_g2_i1.p2 TRINITY_DN8016_c0_g2~~TRINITY_DN8016_c0_g2_i1.p2  ORF type:complete len:171 (+),score=58.95 TRINITY_DN8016_c0_g2_i1:85-597(+)
MLRALTQANPWRVLSLHVHPFGSVTKLKKVLTVRQVKAKGFEIDKDPDKDKLMARLNNRVKELDKLENGFTCVGIKEMLDKYKVNEDGSVVSCLPQLDETPRKFKDMEEYSNFAKKKLKRYYNQLKMKLTPQQLYVTQSCGYEKPFTGLYWSVKGMGMYSCVVCKQKIFT